MIVSQYIAGYDNEPGLGVKMRIRYWAYTLTVLAFAYALVFLAGVHVGHQERQQLKLVKQPEIQTARSADRGKTH